MTSTEVYWELVEFYWYTNARDHDLREPIPHTWASSNDNLLNLILARGQAARLF